jgi:hypothetical protein
MLKNVSFVKSRMKVFAYFLADKPIVDFEILVRAMILKANENERVHPLIYIYIMNKLCLSYQ